MVSGKPVLIAAVAEKTVAIVVGVAQLIIVVQRAEEQWCACNHTSCWRALLLLTIVYDI